MEALTPRLHCRLTSTLTDAGPLPHGAPLFDLQFGLGVPNVAARQTLMYRSSPDIVQITSKQRPLLTRLALFPHGTTIYKLSEEFSGPHPYVVKSRIKCMLYYLADKGLCERISGRPLRFRITTGGCQALEEPDK